MMQSSLAEEKISLATFQPLSQHVSTRMRALESKMDVNFDGDFTAATGDIFGKRRKERKHEKRFHQKDRSGSMFSNRSDEGTKSKRVKSDEYTAAPSSANGTPNRVVSQIFRGVNVAEYIEARALEVANTIEALDEAAMVEGKRVLQRLPRHMRRRAASYDARRIPRNQRKIAEGEVKDNPIKRGKMPSRKHRRRPKNLLDEYNRRKQKHAWLETHIWHAKRFKMVKKWGYKIAEQPCDKGLRSAYRASAAGCLLQDVSFQGCIEINGPENEILEVFQNITSKSVGTSIAAKNVLSGERSCTVLLHNYKSYPYGAVSPVEVLWKPCGEDSGQSESLKYDKEFEINRRTIWIWCHPSSHDDALKLFKDAFLRSGDGEVRFRDEGMEICVNHDALGDAKVNVLNKHDEKEEAGIDEKQNTFDIDAKASNEVMDGCRESECSLDPKPAGCKTSKDLNKEEQEYKAEDAKDEKVPAKPNIHSDVFQISKSIVMKSMKLDFVKFKFTGPLSHQVIANALQLHNVKDTALECWWKNFYSKESNTKLLKGSIDAWKVLSNVSSPGQFPPKVILALTVLDPRMNIPIKKSWPGKDSGDCLSGSNAHDPKKTELLTGWPAFLCQSPIWEKNIRDEVKERKISDAELNKKRSNKLSIGQHLEAADETSRIPILLIQRPGVRNPDSTAQHYGCGWDFIAPSGWGMPFLVSFVYRGAHVGGLREERNSYHEGRIPYFPREFPDTESGKLYLEDEKNYNEETYNRRPASKRANYEKYGLCHPFGADWQSLVIEWKSCCMRVLQSYGSTVCDENADDGMCVDANGGGQVYGEKHENGISYGQSFYVLREKALLRKMMEVLFLQTMHGKSSVVSVTPKSDKRRDLLVYLLHHHENALVTVSFQCIGRGQASDNALISIPISDDFEGIMTDKNCAGPVEPLHKGPKTAFPAIADLFEVDKSLVKNIGLCTRWTIGQVTSGRYSLRTGKGSGIGQVSALGLVACLQAQPSTTDGCIVLIRNISSQQYRFAKINVIV